MYYQHSWYRTYIIALCQTNRRVSKINCKKKWKNIYHKYTVFYESNFLPTLIRYPLYLCFACHDNYIHVFMNPLILWHLKFKINPQSIQTFVISFYNAYSTRQRQKCKLNHETGIKIHLS